MASIRVLGAIDEAAMRAFLAPRAESSMFLLSNARAAGLVDEGKTFQATYVGAFENGELAGIVAHCWNGVLLVQTPAELVSPSTVRALAHAALANSRRTIAGFSGPADQVAVARRAFELPAPALDEVEALYALTLADLRVPDALARREVTCRRPTDAERPQLAAWRRAYHVESLGSADNTELAAKAAREIDDLAASGTIWVLEAAGALVAMTAFNARIPDMVQVGGVYTPPALRGRGHARCAVAGSLLDARADQAGRAILFTKNAAAARAYEAIGFQRIGEYALILQ